jgi:hypothetical protein
MYVSHVRVERIRGPLRAGRGARICRAVYFGVHDEIADHYGVPRGSDAERTTTLDHVVAATAG